MKIKMSKLYVALLACTGTLLTTSTFAAETEEEAQRVEVVGSHIKRTDLEGPSPILTIDRDMIDKSGYNNLQQLLERIPTAGNGTFSTRGNNQDSTANGAAAVSLRGLGADATLVLINGRRVAISSFAEDVTTNFVDINSIPVSAIERVEILKDGASAVYGSDAVAGVVNIVLRNNFVGTEVSMSYGNTTDTDADEKSFSALWGFGGDNSNATLIFDYFSNNTLMNKDRGDLGTANQSANGGEDFRSSRGFPGSFIVDGVATVDPSCDPANIAGAVCVYDYGPWNVLIPEAERVGLMFLGNRQIGNDIELFTEISVQHNTSFAQGAPTPLDGDAGLTVPGNHPDSPFVGATTIDILRFRTVDAGARRWDIESDSLRAVLGLRGSLGTWDWETAIQKGRSESTQTGGRDQGWVRTDLLQAEIDAGRYNPFGGTYNSPDVINAITTSLVRQGESHLTAFDAKFTGDLFDTENGAIAMATGIEYREEDAKDVPDDQFQRGLIFGTESVSAAASRDHWSLFAEFSVPLPANIELQLAARYDDYSDFGTTTNPKVALRWAPNDALAVRASWGTGFRAPSLAQIGLGPSQVSQFFIDSYGCDVNAAYCASTDYTIVFSGNPDLDPEESETFNIGAAWNITDRFSVTLDYWDIVQENKIDEAPFGIVYQLFCNDQNSTVCVRNDPLPGDALGALSRINNSFFNIAEQSATGIDLSLAYGFDVADGNVKLSFDYTRLLDFERVEPELQDDDSIINVSRDLAGEYEYPEDRFVLTGDWSAGDFGAYASINYVGAFEDKPDADFDGTLDYDQNSTPKVDAFVTLNLQARYTGFSNTVLMVGLDNALDEEPPFAIGDGDGDLYGYVQSQHNPRGQFIYGKMTYSF